MNLSSETGNGVPREDEHCDVMVPGSGRERVGNY